MYLGQLQNSQFGFRYDGVMKLCMDISGRIIMSIVKTCLHLSSYWIFFELQIVTISTKIHSMYFLINICKLDRVDLYQRCPCADRNL